MTAHRDVSETAVIREIQAIHQAQIQCLSAFGYDAPTLAQLGPPRDGVIGAHGKNGHLFTVTKTPSASSLPPRRAPN